MKSKILFIFLLFFCIIKIHSTEVVKVGLFETDGYQTIDENNIVSGYNIEYLNQISKYTNWQYKYIKMNFSESLVALENGDVDLVCSIYKNKIREKKFYFPLYDIGTNFGVITINKDDDRFFSEDYQNYNGMTVALRKSDLINKSFLDYEKNNNFKTNKIYCASVEEQIKLLDEKKVDAVVMSFINFSSKYKILERFSLQKQYIAVSKKRLDLFTQLNKSLQQIKKEDQHYDYLLYKKYFQRIQPSNLAWSKSEYEFIKSKPEIKVLYNKDLFPLENFDKSTLAPNGFSINILKLISEITGLNFKYISYKNLDEINKKDFDIISSFITDYSHSHNYDLSKTYISIPVVQIGNNLNNYKSVALPSYYKNFTGLEKLTKNCDIRYYDDLDKMFNCVMKGHIDTLFTNMEIANYFMKKSKYNNLKNFKVLSLKEDLSFGISKTADKNLHQIIDKAFFSITELDVKNIVYQTDLLKINSSLQDLYYEYNFEFIMVFIFCCLLVIGLLIVIAILKNHRKNQINYILNTDSLTGYNNYYSFIIKAKELVKNSNKDRYSFISFDIKNFKYINDTFSYDTGNKILKKISLYLNGCLLSKELFARIYADRFVLLLQYASKKDLENRVTLIKNDIAALFVDAPYVINCTYGIFVFNDVFYTPEIAIDKANYAKDTSMKNYNKDIVFYDDNMQEKILEMEMVPALKNKEFVPYYQPKYNIKTKELIGAEALIRWKSPKLGFMNPGEFIPFFEKNGFIKNIDFFVYEEVCKKISEWINQGKKVFPISCNFSRINIYDEDFVKKITEIANKYSVPHNLLEIEITESAAVENMDLLVDYANKIQEKNFLISIDDFGSGYSSLSLIIKIPIDIIKLDREFIVSFFSSETKNLEKELIKELIIVAHKHNIKVICEGIETKEHENFLKEVDCSFAQGFLYAKPMPVDEFEKLF